MPVFVRYRGTLARKVSSVTVRRRAERMLIALSLAHAELSVVLGDDRVVRELNRGHRKIDRATDVLAFAMCEGERLAGVGPQLLGDVVISVPTAVRQARSQGKTALAEVTFLLAHGLLHLLGYDHATAAQERRMTGHTLRLVAATTGRGHAAVDSLGAIVPRSLRG